QSSTEGERPSCRKPTLWKLPRLMEMWKIKIRKGVILLVIFHIPTAAWKTLHSTSLHSEFPTVPTASAAALYIKEGKTRDEPRRATVFWTTGNQRSRK